MQIKKLNKDEYEITYERFIQHTELGIPLIGEFPLAPDVVDGEVKRYMDCYFKNLDSPTTFSFLYTGYGEPTVGHQKNELFTYSFLVDNHIISIIGYTQSVSFKMLIPPEKMQSFWEDQQSVNDSVARRLFEKGIPLMRESYNLKRLLNEEERQRNTENLIKYAEGLLEPSENVFFSDVIKNNPKLEENQFVRYQDLCWKIFYAVAEETSKEYSAQKVNFPVFAESLPYSEAKSLFFEFCHFLGTKKIHFDSKVLTIRGFEAARRPAYRKPVKPIITEDDTDKG